VDAHGMPVRVIVTKGTTADCKLAIPLIQGISAENLLADRGYDTNKIIDFATQNGMKVVIPSKKPKKSTKI
jgi:transposase